MLQYAEHAALMSIVTVLWCMNAAIALTLAGVCLLFWLVERRDLTYLAFCVVAVATAISIPFELGMMHATTPVEYGELLRWFHVPVFVVLVGYPLFVRLYLGTGRLWLLWAVVSLRVVALLVKFLVDPNLNFREITSLQQVSFLGEQVSVVGQSVVRKTQWLASAGVVLLIAFLIDAAIQSYRRGGVEARRRGLVVGVAILVPLVGTAVLNLLVTNGVLHVPISNTIWFLGTLFVIAFDLARQVVISRRAQLQLSRLQGELARFDRINTLGQFASGLAHDLLQPLTATATNAAAAARLLQQEPLDVAELRDIVVDVQQASTRAADTIHHMRLLIQKRPADKQSVDVDEVVRNVLLLAAPEAASRQVVVDFQVAPDLPPAYCDPIQVSQVLLNLLINAIDAVKTRPPDARRVSVEARAVTNGALELAVVDSGPGIPDGKLDEVFSPLYTTKAAGLGMGLAISRTIIDAHGGRLWAVNSTATGGAVFRFTLPRA